MATYTLEKIDARKEFEKAGMEWEEVGNSEVKLLCPFHKDSNPSFYFNVDKNVGQCKVCNKAVDIVGYFAGRQALRRDVILSDFKTRYDIESVKTIPPERVEEAHNKVWDKQFRSLRDELYARGVTNDDIREHRLGIKDGRITIPVYDEGYRCVNIREYKPGATRKEVKFKNTSGYGEMRIFLPQQITDYDTLWLVGGEMKAIVAARILNTASIGAFTVTAGEGRWNGRWSRRLKGKTIFVCMDVDEAGRKAAIQYVRILKRHCKQIVLLTLPLDTKIYPKGDINDWVGKESADLVDFLALQKEAEELDLKAKERPEPEPIELRECMDKNGQRVEFTATPIAADTSPYLVACQFKVSCLQDQPQCTDCSVANCETNTLGDVVVNIDNYNPGILTFVESTLDTELIRGRKVLGIPQQCKGHSIETTQRKPLYDMRLTDNVDNSVGHIATFTEEQLELNVPHRFIAIPTPSPKDSKLVLLTEHVEPTQDGLDQFKVTKMEMEELKLFQPEEWTKEGIDVKLAEIYDDFESNVTRIYHRRDLHIICDLVFHSPLYLNFDSRKESGWLDAAIIGDSAQGKTETATRLSAFYGLGARADCKNATRAGLVGAVKMLGKRWFISWGVIPANDRRLVILEEAKGLSKSEIAQMTDMRSRGIAELTKVETSQANARTRLIWLSNPRKGEMATFSYGIEAFLDVTGTPEDVRRFDVGLIVHKDEVNSAEIAEFLQSPERVEQKYTKDLCRKLVLFAWSRKEDQVIIPEDVANECIKASVRLSDKFDHTVPLIDHGTARFKLARIAAACAARTFSVYNDSLLLRKCHVDWAEAFLDRIYSTEYNGYSAWSSIRKQATTLRDEEIVKKWILSRRYPLAFVEGILAQEEITRDDLEDWLEVERSEAAKACGLLVRYRCLQRNGRHYVKNPQFIDLLKAMENLPEENEEVSLYSESEM